MEIRPGQQRFQGVTNALCRNLYAAHFQGIDTAISPFINTLPVNGMGIFHSLLGAGGSNRMLTTDGLDHVVELLKKSGSITFFQGRRSACDLSRVTKP